MSTEEGFLREKIEALYHRPFIDGNALELLWRGTDAFEVIGRSVREAKRLICLQFYIYRNDETGTALAELLMQKAREGVKVYLLYDHWGSFLTPKRFWDMLRGAGIEVRASRPLRLRSILQYQRRDHRKLITIDGQTAFTGGLNIANEYWTGIYKGKLPWRDTGILIKGPAAAELSSRFFKAWDRWGQDASPTPLETNPHNGNGLPVLPIFASTFHGRRMMRKLIFYSIYRASEQICLSTAYFVPRRIMVRALRNAVERGVRVRLLVPDISDVISAHYASRHFYTRLLKAGVEIYAYQGTMLHAKTYVFDSEWSIVGSANLDYRSLRHNDEGNVGILDKDFGKRMHEVFEMDLESSRRITLEAWLKRPLMQKVLERFFSLFRRRL